MLQLLIYFFIGISLSMDTFSLSLSIGTTCPSTKQILKCSLIVGLFHFIMPLLGSAIGTLFSSSLLIKANCFTSLIFVILAIEMFINRNSEEKSEILNTISIVLFALSVSMDSFSVGIAFGITKESTIISGMIFSLTSALFTYYGLKLGRKLHEKFEQRTVIIGIVLMLIISFKYLIFG